MIQRAQRSSSLPLEFGASASKVTNASGKGRTFRSGSRYARQKVQVACRSRFGFGTHDVEMREGASFVCLVVFASRSLDLCASSVVNWRATVQYLVCKKKMAEFDVIYCRLPFIGYHQKTKDATTPLLQGHPVLQLPGDGTLWQTAPQVAMAVAVAVLRATPPV